MVAAKKIDKADGELTHSVGTPIGAGKRWPWPAAALIIIVSSLLLWGVIAGIGLLAWN